MQRGTNVANLYRVCPRCRTKNWKDALRCKECQEPLSEVLPTGDVEKAKQAQKECALELVADPGIKLKIFDGLVIGRSPGATDSHFLDCSSFNIPDDQLEYISHRHARFFKDETGQWFVKNLSKTNYTRVNETKHGPEDIDKVETGPVAINEGDLISLTFALFRFHAGA